MFKNYRLILKYLTYVQLKIIKTTKRKLTKNRADDIFEVIMTKIFQN